MGGVLGGVVGYLNAASTDRFYFTLAIAFTGFLVGLVLGVAFDLLSTKLF